MSKLRLTLSCEDYDRTRPLISGAVSPDGIDLNVICLNNPERHTRMMQGLEFDICELSTAQFLTGWTRGMPVTAVPAFPHRQFRHGFIFVNTSAGIDKPADLVGKRMGVSLYMNTAAMWVRGILEEEYGVAFNQMTWVTDLPEEVSDWKPPEGLRIERRAPGKSLDELLVAGDIDAVIFPIALPSIRKGDPRVRRLFPNYKELEMDFYRRTQLFPIMHTVVIKNSVLEANPWVAAEVLKAFDRAKALAWAAQRNEARTMAVWYGETLAEQREVMGPDPWAYGVKANRHALEKMLEFAHRQGLIERRLNPEDLFPKGALEPWPEFAH